MNMRQALLISTLSAGIVLGGTAASAADDRRPTLAIVGFETTPGGWVLPPPQLGTTLGDLLLDKLVSNGSFHVVDGQWLRPARRSPRDLAGLEELRANARAAGVDYLVLGSITRFSTENGQRTVGGGGFRLPILGGLRRHKTEMVVSIVARVVDVRSGEVVVSTTGQGTASRKNVSAGGLAFGRLAGALAVANVALQARDALLDEAVERCIANAAHGLVVAAPRLTRVAAADSQH